jgi:hypothetical protein
MIGLHRVFDAAYPPATAPPGVDAVLGYLGGQRAAHTWTLPEWDRFRHLRQYPCYVPDTTAESPLTAAYRAAVAAKGLGWAPFQPDRRVIICDLETQIVPGWYQQFAAELEQQGFTAAAYGSLSTILANAAAAVWVAAWDEMAQLLSGQTLHAHQYAALAAWDLSVADDWMWSRAGQGPRHA